MSADQINEDGSENDQRNYGYETNERNESNKYHNEQKNSQNEDNTSQSLPDVDEHARDESTFPNLT